MIGSLPIWQTKRCASSASSSWGGIEATYRGKSPHRNFWIMVGQSEGWRRKRSWKPLRVNSPFRVRSSNLPPFNGPLTQLVDVSVLNIECSRFESERDYQKKKDVDNKEIVCLNSNIVIKKITPLLMKIRRHMKQHVKLHIKNTNAWQSSKLLLSLSYEISKVYGPVVEWYTRQS